MSSLISVLLALRSWLRQRHVQFLWRAGAAIIMFRAELAAFLGLLLLMDLAFRRVSLTTVVKTTLPAGLVILGG